MWELPPHQSRRTTVTRQPSGLHAPAVTAHPVQELYKGIGIYKAVKYSLIVTYVRNSVLTYDRTSP